MVSHRAAEDAEAKEIDLIGWIERANWYRYAEDGSNPSTPCDTGEYYYFYDALGNVVGVQQEGYYSGAPTNFYRWEMDAFGDPLSGGNDFLAMDKPSPKEIQQGIIRVLWTEEIFN